MAVVHSVLQRVDQAGGRVEAAGAAEVAAGVALRAPPIPRIHRIFRSGPGVYRLP